MNTAPPDPLLTRLELIADAVGGAHGAQIRATVSVLRAQMEAARLRADELASAQADAIVNAGMMMSELQETHAQLEQALVAAESADRAKSEFLAHMSHEIRTPFNGVLGMTEILLKTTLNERQRHCVLTIQDSADALLAIINDILDFSKIEAGRLSLQAYPFRLRELVEAVAHTFAERVQKKRVELLCSIPHDIPGEWIGDGGRLRQVLTNLLGNAVKFTDRGEIGIAVSMPRHVDERHAMLRFDVTDTGIGIPEAAQQRIFDAFAQADDATERIYGGTGLGLAICARLVSMMGGKIQVESAPGNGARFWFEVRLERGSSEVQASVGGRTGLGAGRRILVVDDNSTNREICVEQLRVLDVVANSAMNAHEALDLMRNAQQRGKPYDLAILDMQMPEMDGLQLAYAMADDPALRSIKRILLSSVGDVERVEHLRDAGIERSVTKPVRQSELQHCVIEVLGLGTVNVTQNATRRAKRRFGGRVLVAEDNPVNQLVVRAMLEELGLDCDIYDDGEAAVAGWERGAYDLILMDCQLPRVDGFEATRRIRAAERVRSGARIPIVALTANAIMGDREACLDAGMDDYLSKPYTERALSDTLARWIVPIAESDLTYVI